MIESATVNLFHLFRSKTTDSFVSTFAAAQQLCCNKVSTTSSGRTCQRWDASRNFFLLIHCHEIQTTRINPTFDQPDQPFLVTVVLQLTKQIRDLGVILLIDKVIGSDTSS